jgi:hypothetical protein
MNVDPENFDALRKLLALKRLEQPPPGYFNRLSGNIVTRLELGESRSSVWERLASSWTVRPALTYSLALSICCAGAVTAVYSLRDNAARADAQIAATDDWKSPTPAMMGIAETRVLHVANWTPQTNPAAYAGPAHALFSPANLLSVPVAYHSGQ